MIVDELKKIIEKQKLTQVSIAERCGFTQSYVSKALSGERPMSVPFLCALCALLEIDPRIVAAKQAFEEVDRALAQSEKPIETAEAGVANGQVTAKRPKRLAHGSQRQGLKS